MVNSKSWTTWLTTWLQRKWWSKCKTRKKTQGQRKRQRSHSTLWICHRFSKTNQIKTRNQKQRKDRVDAIKSKPKWKNRLTNQMPNKNNLQSNRNQTKFKSKANKINFRPIKSTRKKANNSQVQVRKNNRRVKRSINKSKGLLKIPTSHWKVKKVVKTLIKINHFRIQRETPTKRRNLKRAKRLTVSSKTNISPQPQRDPKDRKWT